VKKLLLVSVVLFAGCASTPTGPGVLVLPGTGKSFDQFRAEEQECRQYAHAQVSGGNDGTLAGAGPSDPSGRTLQQRYDFAYQQCMYAKGHKIPMSREQAERYAPKSGSSTPPPPPPPGKPPAGTPPDLK
jgi:hypothetical protein